MKAISNFSKYYVDDLGNIYNKNRKLIPVKDKDGYYIVCLQTNNNKQVNKKVHRLVLETLVGSCPEGMITRHLDGVKSNNELTNLKWGTRSENEIDKIKHGVSNRGIHRNWNVRFHIGEIWLIKKLLFFEIRPYIIAKMFKRNHARIGEIKSGKVWQYISYNERTN